MVNHQIYRNGKNGRDKKDDNSSKLGLEFMLMDIVDMHREKKITIKQIKKTMYKINLR